MRVSAINVKRAHFPLDKMVFFLCWNMQQLADASCRAFPLFETDKMNTTSRQLRRNAWATIFIAAALCISTASAYAADEHDSASSSTLHPVDATKHAAKAVGHGVKKTTTAIGHGFRDG